MTIRRDRPTGGGVGVAVLIQEKMQIIHQETFETKHMEGICVEVAGRPKNINIINIYCPKGKIEKEDIEGLQKRIKMNTLIMGD